jgi:GGDEF domain-containing protein
VLHVDLEGAVLNVGASVGTSVYPDDSCDYAELLQHADIAMYAADRGRSEIAVYQAITERAS